MNANQLNTVANNNVAKRFEQLRLKLIRETERYLNNPCAETWGRLSSLRLERGPKLVAA